MYVTWINLCIQLEAPMENGMVAVGLNMKDKIMATELKI